MPGLLGRAFLDCQYSRLRDCVSRYTPDDLADLAAMFADEETMTFYPRTKTREESLGWIEWNLGLYESHGFGLWVMESRETGAFIGDCGLTPQTVDGVTNIELGWHTKRECWNRGFATEAATPVGI